MNNKGGNGEGKKRKRGGNYAERVNRKREKKIKKRLRRKKKADWY